MIIDFDARYLPTEKMSQFPSLVSLLLDRAEANPDKIAFEYLRSDGNSGNTITYLGLIYRASAIGGYLQARFIPGDRIALLFSPGLEFITGLFGCLMAGMIAVPLAPPAKRNSRGFGMMASDAEIAAVLGAGVQFERWRQSLYLTSEFDNVAWICADHIGDISYDTWRFPNLKGSDLAILQYTSGSTRNPRGVALSHLNILSNSEVIKRCFGNGPHTVGVSWLPYHHDMGLIGNIIQPLYVGGSCVLMAPTTFLHRPQLWLKTISSRHATTSGGPSFAYEQCVNRVDMADMADVDLSSWHVAYCGAEPIRHNALLGFAEKFQPCGFRCEALVPCYGLAEATLMVSCALTDQPLSIFHADTDALSHGIAKLANLDTRGTYLVGCGHSDSGQKFIIVDSRERRQLTEGNVGEIWVQGDSIAIGYYGASDCADQFQVKIPGLAGDWLRTGDLGFLYNNQLYVLGRDHDQLIILGRNIFAHDIEWALFDIESGLGRSVALAGEQSDQLIIIQELAQRSTKLDIPLLITEIRKRVLGTFGVIPFAVAIVSFGSIPLTTSGKPRRRRCRELFLQNELQLAGGWSRNDEEPMTMQQDEGFSPSKGEIAEWLVHKLANRLQIVSEQLDKNTPFFDFGLTSIDAVELCLEMEQWLKRPLSPTIIFSRPTIDSLSEWLTGSNSAESSQPVNLQPVSEGDQDILKMSPDMLEEWISSQFSKHREKGE